MYKNIPQELKEAERWVNWKLAKRNGKNTKIPINSKTGGNASTTNSDTWSSYSQAVEEAPKHSGIGFVLGDGYIGVDIDNKEQEVKEYKNGNANNVIGKFINKLGSYAEYSPSGNGIHILGKGTKPDGKCRKGDFEVYDGNGRYFTVTGDIANDKRELKDITEDIKPLFSEYIDKGKPSTTTERKENIQPLDLTEQEVIKIASNSKNGQKFQDLLNGNWEAYFPSQSEADLSLCNDLAFYTGKDFNMIDNIFRSSGLYRTKWDRRTGQATYGVNTINEAIAGTTDTFKPKKSYGIEILDKKNSTSGRDTKQAENGVSTSNYNIEDEKNKAIPRWYSVNENTGRFRLITGILADYLAENKPAIYTTGRFYLYQNGVYNICDDRQEETVVMDHIRSDCRTMKHIKDVASQWAISKKVRIAPDQLNKDPYILNLKNGLYDLRTNKLEEHTPRIKSTIRINAEYEPEAKGKVFDRFIKEVVPDKNNRLLVQEMVGYSITSFNNAKKMFILDGKGDTGKSTLLNVIEALLTEKNVSNVMLQKLSDRFSTAQLFGKTANIFADLPSTALKGDSIFKALTGDDKVQAERKGQDPFNFYNKAKLIFSCNGLPDNYGDRSDAFYNRLIILPFNHSVPKEKQDPHLNDKLEKELNHILNWAINGLKRLIKNNFVFTENQATKELVEEYKVNSNSVLLFINDMCEIEESNIVSTTELYKNYKLYCEENGLMPLKTIKFYREIENNYPNEILRAENIRVPETHKRAFKGIRLIQRYQENNGKIELIQCKL